jgi:hypothetical protein
MIAEIVTNVAIMAAIVIFVSELLTKLTKVANFWAQFQSWAVSVVVAALASYLGVGIFPTFSALAVVLYGFGIGLVANGIFDIPLTRTILEWIRVKAASL